MIDTAPTTAPALPDPPKRLLLGPGPSEVDPVVLQALALPPLGHLDPALLALMDELEAMLRRVFQTQNRLTLAISGTGSAGMEAALLNTVAPGDRVLVGVIGYFGERLCAVAERLGGAMTRLDGEWGKPLAPEAVIAAIRRTQPAVVALVHAETSTGVLQPLDGIGAAAHEAGALLVLDTVTSLGGHPVAVDDWGVDACYSGSQKCLGAPSGLAPFTLSARALERLEQRAAPPGGYYLDARLLSQYWDERQYHHTISAPLIYALYTALRRLEAEGLERRWARHHLQHRAFRAGCAALGLEFLPDEQDSLWPLNAVRVPEGLDDARARAALRDHHSIEIGGGMGPLKGKLWRVGLMGYGARQEFVLELLGALELMLATHGHAPAPGAGVGAAMAVYATAAAQGDHGQVG
jgi:alanine-glyoxylate transaminase / serine-glyoxylate transaminase / serine-pyruvate transaminase